jgi:hypothetical protein
MSMTDSEKPLSGDHVNGSTHYQPEEKGPPSDIGETGRALVIGILGGLVSAAGYMVYRRLPDEQRERLNSQVRSVVETRINEIRSNLNI